MELNNAKPSDIATAEVAESVGSLCFICLDYGPLRSLSFVEPFGGFVTPRSGGSYTYGNIEELRSRQACRFCRLVCRLIPPDLPSTTQIYIRSPSSASGGIVDAPLDIYADRQFQGRIEYSNNFFDGNEETVPPNVEPALVREWLQCCEEDHDHSRLRYCRLYQTPIDITLVDTAEHRLVRASSRNRYLALSYVWGEVPLFQSTMSNRLSLEEPGSLLKVTEIPQVIQDSMALVSSLGERYLWVDCLCIEQDNESQKHTQIVQMDVIYSQAVATIVALSALNATFGLPGVSRNTILPSLSYETICKLRLTARAPTFHENITNAHYESRAWTLQERLLSKRCLLFTSTGIYFHCSYGLRSVLGGQDLFDDGLFNSLPNCLLELTPQKETARWSDAFPGYGRLVREYTQRHLSYSSDALNAFSGLLELFKHRLGGEMISGLPSKLFDAAILWVPMNERQQLARNFQFPSWSWAGWSGPVQYCAWPDYFSSACSPKRWYLLYEPLLLSRPLRSAVAKFYYSRQAPKLEIDRDISDMEREETHSSDIIATKTHLGKEAISRDVLEFDALAVNIAKIWGHILLYSQPINDQRNNKGYCGAVLSAGQILENYEQRSTDLVLLSRFSPLSLDHNGDPNRIYFDPEVYPARKWCLLNLIIISWNSTGDCAERLGLCVLHEDVWNRLDPHLKKIKLA